MIISVMKTSEKRKIRAAINLFGIQDEDSDFVDLIEAVSYTHLTLPTTPYV